MVLISCNTLARPKIHLLFTEANLKPDISCVTWCRRYEADGIDGLIDLRIGQVSHRRAPVDEVMALADSYRSRYVGWTAKHFYTKYQAQGGVRSYNFVRLALQQHGMVAKANAWRASTQAGAQAADRHDAAPGRVPA